MSESNIVAQAQCEVKTIKPDFNFASLRIADEDLRSDIEQSEKAFKTLRNHSSPKPDLTNWREVLRDLKVVPHQIYSEPPICITFEDNEGSSRFGTLGNFSAVIGKAKSRKTFLISLILSSAFRESSKVSIKLPEGKERCIYFDTEQSTYDVSKVVNRIVPMEEIENIKFEAYGLRKMATKDRLFLIEQKVNNTEDCLFRSI